jgi:hypothetical protein
MDQSEGRQKIPQNILLPRLRPSSCPPQIILLLRLRLSSCCASGYPLAAPQTISTLSPLTLNVKRTCPVVVLPVFAWFGFECLQAAEQARVRDVDEKATTVPFFAYQGMNIVHPAYFTNAYWFDKVNQSAVTAPSWSVVALSATD